MAKAVSDAAYASHRMVAFEAGTGEAISSRALRIRSIKRANHLLDNILQRFPGEARYIEALREAVSVVDKAGMSVQENSDNIRKGNDQSTLALLDQAYFGFNQTYMKLFDLVASTATFRAETLERSTSRVIIFALVGSLGGMLAGILLSLFVSSRGITRPLLMLSGAMKALASGDAQVAISGIRRRDEIGEMARAVEVFKQAANENSRLAEEANAAQRERVEITDRKLAEDASRANRITDLIGQVKAAFEGLASGELDTRMGKPVSAEFEPIRISFNTSVARLEETISAVEDGVRSMQGDLQSIAHSSFDLSKRTEQQAAALEETSASLVEVMKKVDLTSAMSNDAAKMAALAHAEVNSGRVVLADAISAMTEIQRSSEQINSIVGLIDQIAFQTNLLALNAGVEAARAGDTGKGFAVVAHEVRALAQRSAGAAQEIKELISRTSGQVSQGAALVMESGTILEKIVVQVDSVSSAVAAIALGAQDQAVSLHQVSAAALEMDNVTQQNAGMVEETAAATQSLLSETEHLAAIMARFQTSASKTGSQEIGSQRAA
jgi:methyl-accepting chemotaxis protein